ncbi:MAG TPA: divalent-cation tolerance protein CutA [Chthoniobacteraceae bacterium]|jgi:periplasmic divalent cation tolerance protein|nr:divalent-cation tolerance protein CutA [Chthoniobacteraceae bacterium]
MAEEAVVVFTTFPDQDTARRIVRTLVEERLVACGNLVPGVESIYRWKGEVETSAEVFAVLKTELSQYTAMEGRLKELHPYEVPECIMLRVRDGLPEYLRWVTESLVG